jgi:hypothetical protein
MFGAIFVMHHFVSLLFPDLLKEGKVKETSEMRQERTRKMFTRKWQELAFIVLVLSLKEMPFGSKGSICSASLNALNVTNMILHQAFTVSIPSPDSNVFLLQESKDEKSNHFILQTPFHHWLR